MDMGAGHGNISLGLTYYFNKVIEKNHELKSLLKPRVMKSLILELKSLGYTADDFKDAGYTALDLKLFYNFPALKKAGFNDNELKQAGF